MRYKLDGKELEKIDEVISITSGDYDLEGDYIPVEGLISAIEDLLCEIHNQEERYEKLEEQLQEFYEPISPYKLNGVSEEDFR